MRPLGAARLPPEGEQFALGAALRAHWTTFGMLQDASVLRNAPPLTRRTVWVDVRFRLPCPRGDCPARWPLDGPYETRSLRGAGRPRRATGCSAKVRSQERRSVSDPRGLPARQVIPQLP